MCELLGMSFNLPVNPRISFRGFRLRGKYNRDGWGLAFYPDESAQIFKEPIKAGESALSEFLKNYTEIRSKIFIGHVRYASRGGISHKNTHPFSRELFGREYVFAHNGNLECKDLELGSFKPIGETDSEHAFCHLLHCIKQRKVVDWKEEDFEWLAEKLIEINKYGNFNCIFSDGTYLFCYSDKNRYNNLRFVHRKSPYGKIKLLDDDWDIELDKDNFIDLSKEKEPEQTGYIIATRELTDEKWLKFEPGELIVFKDGRIIYSNKRPSEGMEMDVLIAIRRSPHRISLREISNKTGRSMEEVTRAVRSLLKKKYIRQDRRDVVRWYEESATFYTEPSRRREIDELIGFSSGD